MGRRGWKGAQEDKEVKDREEECRLRARHPRRFNKPSPGCLLCDQDHLFANCPFRSYEEEPERPQPKREEKEGGVGASTAQRRGSRCVHSPKKGESVRPQPKEGGVGASTAQRRGSRCVHSPKKGESVRPQPKEGGVGASTAQKGGVGASTAQEGGVGASKAR
ncbi:UNVERIFIED_CONTAM: hypothetical protein FKN15_006661 [Acipenser sinensis]